MSSQENSRQVVITGLGIISPCGIGVASFWENLFAGKSGVSKLKLHEFCAAPGNVGGEVSDFTESSAKKSYLKPLRKSIKLMCREIQMGVASAAIALEHSRLNLDEIDHSRLGVDFGANLMLSPPDVLRDACSRCIDNETDFNFNRWGHEGFEGMEPLWLLKYLPNMPGCHIGIASDARGPNNSLTQGEASSNLAIGEALRILQRDCADIMIAGTTGTRLHPVKALHAALWDKLADCPEEAEKRSRPFDKNRSGEVLGEAAGSIILEEESHAQKRNATIYGKLLGTGASCVVDRAGNANPRLALANAMRAALRSANLSPDEIGHINAHGLSTRECDIAEAKAIQDVFGSRSSEIPVTALKSYFGNSGAGCGTIELAGSILSLEHQMVLPTLNYETPDPECPLNVVHGEPLPIDNPVFLKTNVTRMGQASAVICTV